MEHALEGGCRSCSCSSTLTIGRPAREHPALDPRSVPLVAVGGGVRRAEVDEAALEGIEELARTIMAAADRPQRWTQHMHPAIGERSGCERGVAHVPRDQDKRAIDQVRWRRP